MVIHGENVMNCGVRRCDIQTSPAIYLNFTHIIQTTQILTKTGEINQKTPTTPKH